MLTHTFTGGYSQMSSYGFSLNYGEAWPSFEVPDDSEFLEKNGYAGPATVTWSMDSFDATEAWGVAYENYGCTGV